eukprot:2006878-Alexandrium_andersonii.AAC.1
MSSTSASSMAMLPSGPTCWHPSAAQPVPHVPGNGVPFSGVLGRDPAQDRRAERWWVDRCVGRE